MNVGYANMERVRNITSSQQEDVQRMRSRTLLHWHRAVTVALQVLEYFLFSCHVYLQFFLAWSSQSYTSGGGATEKVKDQACDHVMRSFISDWSSSLSY